jgi:hypothetical protein
MKDILPLDAVTSEAPGVGAISDLKHAAANVRRMSREEALYVIAIDRCPAAIAEIPAERLRASQLSMR